MYTRRYEVASFASEFVQLFTPCRVESSSKLTVKRKKASVLLKVFKCHAAFAMVPKASFVKL
jgi:hypothetical protein